LRQPCRAAKPEIRRPGSRSMNGSGMVPGNVNSDQPIDAVRVSIDQTRTARRVRRSIVHAAGFGGPTAVLGLVSLPAQDR